MVLTFLTLVLLISGICISKAWPVAGFIVCAASAYMATAAMRRADDIQEFMGVCIFIGAAYSVYLVGAKIL
jgi:hypothetical protein